MLDCDQKAEGDNDMANKGRSTPGLFGTINHYDEHGKKIGRSEPGFFGGSE